MANFVEQATLKINDQSSAQLRKINKELASLFKSARGFSGKGVNLKVMSTGGAKALRELTLLKSAANSLNLKSISPRVNLASIKALESSLLRIKSLQASIGNKAISGPTAGAPVQPRPVRNNGGGNYFNNNGIAGFLKRIVIGDIVINARTAIINSAKEGYKTNATADFLLASQQLTKEQKRQADAAVSGVVKTQAGMNSPQTLTVDQIKGLVAENISVALNSEGKPDFKGVEFITNELANLIKEQVARGATVESATQEAMDYSKSGQGAGKFSDVNGNFDYAGAKAYFEFIRRTQILVGKEATGAFIRNNIKTLRGSKFGLNDDSLLMTMLMAEEDGTSAGVGTNQMIKQLSGNGVTDKALAKQIELGLANGKEIETGKTGGKKTTKIVGNGSVDEELLRTNPLKFVNDYIMPKFKAQGGDATSATDVAKFANGIVSDRTAVQALSNLMLRLGELQASIARSKDVNPTSETADGLVAKSGLVGVAAVQNQFQGVFGILFSALNEDFILPATNALSGMLMGLQTFMLNEDGTPNKLGGAMVAGGAAVGGLGAAFGVKKLFEIFSGAAALNASALALDGSAAALTLAASRLGATGAIPAAAGGAASATTASGLASVGLVLKTALSAAAKIISVTSAATLGDEEVMSNNQTVTKEARRLYGDATVREARKKSGAWFTTDDLNSGDSRDLEFVKKYMEKQRRMRAGAKEPSTAKYLSPPAMFLDAQSNQGEVSRLTARLPQEVEAAKITFDTAFNGGVGRINGATTALNASVSNVVASAPAFGSTAAQSILAVAPAFGSAVAAAISAAVANINVNAGDQVSKPASKKTRGAPDTGYQGFGGPR